MNKKILPWLLLAVLIAILGYTYVTRGNIPSEELDHVASASASSTIFFEGAGGWEELKATFTSLGHSALWRANDFSGVYQYTSPGRGIVMVLIPFLDPYTIERIRIGDGEATGLELYKDANGLYRFSKNNVLEKIPGGDPATLKSIGNYGVAENVSVKYLADKNNVYYGTSVIPQAEPATFDILDNLGWYAKDSDTAFAHGKPIANADAVSFQWVHINEAGVYPSDTASYAKDKNYVYFGNRILPDADPATFTLITATTTAPVGGLLPSGSIITYVEGGITKDAERVYFLGQLIKNADPATFARVQNDYLVIFTDKSRVYHLYSYDVAGSFLGVVGGADPVSFRVLSKSYAKDAQHVFHLPVKGPLEILEDADPKTFDPNKI